MIMPKVSVVMTTYNQEAFIGSTIASVTGQSIPDWELIAVDDGSRDACHAIATEYSRQDSRIHAFPKENGGHSSALNFGYRKCASDSPYVFFLDGDDMIYPEYLDVMSAYLDSHPNAGLVCCHSDRCDADGSNRRYNHRGRWAPGVCGFPRDLPAAETRTPFVTFFCATGQGMTGLYRRAVFEQTEGWDCRLTRHEDTDMFCQMALLAEVHYLPRVLYTYRLHGKNVTRLSDEEAGNIFQTFTLEAHKVFREKWNSYIPRNAHERKTLDAAKRYYYGVHRPLRHLKICLESIRLFLKTGDVRSLKWAMQLVKFFFVDASKYWFLGRTE